MNRAQRRAAMRHTVDQSAPVNAHPPISDAQLAANRANAQHSTGPVTSEGRARSSQNRLTHGLARHNGAFQVLPTEDPNGFEALRDSLTAEHQPSTPDEFALVNETAESLWLAQRAKNLQNACFDPATGELIDVKKFEVYLRYGTSHANQFHKCLNAILKIRAQREKTANGFEAQKRHAEELRLKTERHEMRKQAQQDRSQNIQAQNLINFMKGTAGDPDLSARLQSQLEELLLKRAAR